MGQDKGSLPKYKNHKKYIALKLFHFHVFELIISNEQNLVEDHMLTIYMEQKTR